MLYSKTESITSLNRLLLSCIFYCVCVTSIFNYSTTVHTESLYLSAWISFRIHKVNWTTEMNICVSLLTPAPQPVHQSVTHALVPPSRPLQVLWGPGSEGRAPDYQPWARHQLRVRPGHRGGAHGGRGRCSGQRTPGSERLSHRHLFFSAHGANTASTAPLHSTWTLSDITGIKKNRWKDFI